MKIIINTKNMCQMIQLSYEGSSANFLASDTEKIL